MCDLQKHQLSAFYSGGSAGVPAICSSVKPPSSSLLVLDMHFRNRDILHDAALSISESHAGGQTRGETRRHKVEKWEEPQGVALRHTAAPNTEASVSACWQPAHGSVFQFLLRVVSTHPCLTPFGTHWQNGSAVFPFFLCFFFFWGIMWSTLDNEMRSSNTPCLVITGAGTNQILSLADRFSSLAIN